MGSDEREALIRQYIPLVKKIARRIHRMVPSVDIGDLIGDGSIGLIHAVDNFDPARGTPLETYARHLIAGKMLNGIRRMDPVSERARRAVRDGESERYRLATERGYLPSTREIEERCPGYARAAIASRRFVPLSLDAPLPDGMSPPSDWSADPAAIFMNNEKREALRALLKRLPDRQRRVLHAHYFQGQSLRDIGKAMRISSQRASQLHLAGIRRLQKAARASH